MSHLGRLALLATLLGTTATADAAKKKKPPVVEPADDEEEEEAAPPPKKHVAEVEEEEAEPVEEPEVVVHKHVKTPRKNDWNFAIGPYLWASDVDANVSVGGSNVAKGLDFNSISSHARFGLPLQSEIRYGKFAFAGDLTYGVIDMGFNENAGPVMATVQGTVNSTMVDAFAGYTVLGDEHAMVSLEPRLGLRYSKTEIRGAAEVEDQTAAMLVSIQASKDLLAGARVFLRPLPWLFASAEFDHGLVGDSADTWSAMFLANLKLGRHVQLAAGYRTLTTETAGTNLVMHGPRFSISVLF